MKIYTNVDLTESCKKVSSGEIKFYFLNKKKYKVIKEITDYPFYEYEIKYFTYLKYKNRKGSSLIPLKELKLFKDYHKIK